MDAQVARAMLTKLGVEGADKAISMLKDGHTSLLQTEKGATIAILRRGNTYDSLLVGAEVEGLALPLRAVLEDAFLPLSEQYASQVGVALHERDAIRKRIREAAVALDVIANGRMVSVSPPEISIHPRLQDFVEQGMVSVDQLPDDFVDDFSVLNQLQASVLSWSSEIDRVVQTSRNGPGAVLTAEEETVFWSSLDSALSTAQRLLSSTGVKIALDILARKRRSTGFLIEATSTLSTARRNTTAVLGLVQGLPIVALRTAEDLPSLKEAAVKLLEHFSTKIRSSSFSVDRSLSLIRSMGDDVTRSVARILSDHTNILALPFFQFSDIIDQCCNLFDAWSRGYENCREVVREAARIRGERLPPRTQTIIAQLHSHLTDLYELRADHHSLRNLLLELANNNGQSANCIEVLDTAYRSLVEGASSLNHFALTEYGEEKWIALVGTYRGFLSNIEKFVCSDFSDIVSRASDVASLAAAVSPFANVIEKQFISATVEDTLPTLLRLASNELKLLQAREQRVNSRDLNSLLGEVPVICIVVAEFRELCSRADVLLRNVDRVVGKTRTEVIPDLKDFVAGVVILQRRLEPTTKFMEWINTIETKIPSVPLLRIKRDESNRHRMAVGIDINLAFFSTTFKVMSRNPAVSKVLSQRHFELSRAALDLNPIYTDLCQALKCHSCILKCLEESETRKQNRLYMFVSKSLQQFEILLETGFSFHWDSDLSRLSTYSAGLSAHTSSVVNMYNLVIENDEGIRTAINKLLSVTASLDDSLFVTDLLTSVKVVFEQLCAYKSSLSSHFPADDVNLYFVKSWKHELLSALSHVLYISFQTILDAAKTPGLCHIRITLGTSRGGEETLHLSCSPSLSTAEQFLLNLIGSNLSKLYKLFVSGLTSIGFSCHDADGMITNLVNEHCFHDGEGRPPTLQCNLSSAVSENVDAARVLIQRWEKLVIYCLDSFSFDSGADADKNGNVFNEISVIAEVYGSVLVLQKEDQDRKARETLISVDSSALSSKILANTKRMIINRIEECAIESGRMSQNLYKKISDSLRLLSNLAPATSLDDLLCLQNLNEKVFPYCRRTIEELRGREAVFERVANNIMRASLRKVQGAESWIFCRDLEKSLKLLENLIAARTRQATSKRSRLLEQFEKMSSAHNQTLSALFADFQRIREQECGQHSFVATEESLQDLEHRLFTLETESTNMELVGKALSIPHPSQKADIRGILSELQRLRKAVKQFSEVEAELQSLGETLFGSADIAYVADRLEVYMANVDEIAKQFGSDFGCCGLRERISRYLKQQGLLSSLHGLKLSPPRERDVLSRLFGMSLRNEGVSAVPLKMFWNADLSLHEEYLKSVFATAAAEASISDFLDGIEKTWCARKCQFIQRDDVFLLQGITELLDELDEHVQALATMKASPHAKLFESERALWENRLSALHMRIGLLADVQSRWAHLKTLFGTRGRTRDSSAFNELQNEIRSFSNVDARFSALGVALSTAPGLLEGFDDDARLGQMQQELKCIVRGLASFLERQRAQFPRFFFLSDDDLLQVLSISPFKFEGLRPHISKMFPGVSTFMIGESGDDVQVVSTESSEGENLVLLDPVGVSKSSIVSCLRHLERAIQDTLKSALREAVESVSRWIAEGTASSESVYLRFGKFPLQVVILALRICFTEEVDLCLQHYSNVQDRLAEFGTLINHNLSCVCSSKEIPLDSQVPSRVFAIFRDFLIKELVYQRDLVARLQKSVNFSGSKHVWENELRMYWNGDNNRSESIRVTARCSSAELEYGWEYLGIGDALVRTDLTSRCFLIFSEALRQGFGGSPFGPAGTGKTETVKAMGRYLGRFVAVFNCDESFDSVAVGRILAGACRIGCWVCFDEFNRLSSNSLSSTSSHLALLQDAIKKNGSEVPNFYGGDIDIKIMPGVAIFITMNPTYTGRRELPANLKSLFRPCSMSKPDSQPIAEVLMLSEGFRCSELLSGKVVSLFKALQSVLSNQKHYDFGLRSLKSTIIACGSLLRAPSDQMEGETDAHEESVMIRGIDEVLKPKLHSEDVFEYERLLHGTFLNTTGPARCFLRELDAAILKQMTGMECVHDEIFIEKTRQLYSLIQHHVGVILVGTTGSAKSSVWKALFEAMKLMASLRRSETKNSKLARSSLTVLDPKLLSNKELYGSLDPLTREWHDGLFTKVLRSIAEERSANEDPALPLHWIVFDGDVDPDWVETLNSVLDDNRILTLPNGEQIPLLSNTRIVFETDNLLHANPSTVSRCGMICFGSESFIEPSFIAAVSALMKSFSPSFSAPPFIPKLCTIIFWTAKDVVKGSKLVMDVPVQSLLATFIMLLRHTLDDILLEKNTRPEKKGSESQIAENTLLSNIVIIRSILVAAGKALGSGLSQADRFELSNLLVKRCREIEEADAAFNGIVIPTLSDVYVSANGEFIEYSDVSKAEADSFGGAIASPDNVISTPTTIRLQSLLSDALNLAVHQTSKSRPVILCGPPGCGKSMILTSALREIPNVSLTTISFSSETTPANILASLNAHATLTKRVNGTYLLHPKCAGNRVVLFCDEVNLEKPDIYDSQRSIALLRSLIEHGGFWTGASPYWVCIEGIQVVAACNPSDDAGRHRLPQRFLRHCCVVRVEEPNARDLKIIYGAFAESLLRQVHPDFLTKSECFTLAMIDFYFQNKAKFSPARGGPIEAHYIYSPRDLSRWIRGMAMILFGPGNRLEDDGRKFLSVDQDSLWIEVISSFCYEARRLFRDRLVSEDGRSFVESILFTLVRKHLNPVARSIPEMLYTTWTLTEPETVQRTFRVLDNPWDFRAMIYSKLRVFAEDQGLGGTWISGNGEEKSEDSTMIDQFAVTDDVLTHLTRIERILCQPLGHAVLMGAPGTGKKTMARFAAWMLSMEVHQVRSHSLYTEQEFAKDLRAILRRASVENKQVVMIFDESHAMETAFLEMMNSLLACGEVPGLFSGDERANLLEDLRQLSTSLATEIALYNEFVRRVRQNLHIVFTISLISPAVMSQKIPKQSSTLAVLSERSPALYNRCTIDWVGNWSKETLNAVAELKVEVAFGSEREKITECIADIHEHVSKFVNCLGTCALVTPRHYLEFIEQFNRIALEKGNNINKGVDRYKVGLERLKAAGAAVEDLKEQLCLKAESLRQKEACANETLQEMMREQRLAEKSKVDAEQLAQAAADASEEAKLREEDVACQLENVLPQLEAARVAVGSIRKENLEELRAMPKPPELVRITMEAVVTMLDCKIRRQNTQLTWGNIRTRMRSSDFIPSVISFDVDQLTTNTRTLLTRKVIDNPSFDVDKITYASCAAGPLAEWILAIISFASAKDSVEPLEHEVASLQQQQQELMERQELELENVNQFQERIETCRTEYARLVSEAERVRQDISESETNLSRAEKVLDSLDREWYRWINDLNALNKAAVTLWGDSIFAATFISYAGALDHLSRNKLCVTSNEILSKYNVAYDDKMVLTDFLITPEERGTWSTAGLSTDSTSLENYAILKRSARFPLIIDPSRSCAELLRKLLCKSSRNGGKNSDAEELCVSVSSFAVTGKKSYMRPLESAVRFGTVIVLEDTERYDRAVTPLLGQEIFYGTTQKNEELDSPRVSTQPGTGSKMAKGMSHHVVRLRDKDVFVDTRFRMFLTAANLESVPQVAITRSNVVSFELSPAAMGAACVSKTLKILAPDVEQRRAQSLIARVAFENRKKVLEEKVLSTVNNAENLGVKLLSGSLLDDLSSLKREVAVIEDREKEEIATIEEIKQNELTFEPLGKVAVDAFLVIQALPSLNPIYRFNTEFFMDVFENAIRSCADHYSRKKSVSDCQKAVISHILTETVGSLFPRDRLAFASAVVMVSVHNYLSLVETKHIRSTFDALNGSTFRLEQILSDLDAPTENSFLQTIPKELLQIAHAEITENEHSSSYSILQCALRILTESISFPHRLTSAIEKFVCTIPGGESAVHGTSCGPEFVLRKKVSTFATENAAAERATGLTIQPILLCSRGEACDPSSLVVEYANNAGVGVISLAVGSTTIDDALFKAISTATQKCTQGRRVLVLIKNMHLSSSFTVGRLHAELAKNKGRLGCLFVVAMEVSSDYSKEIVISMAPFFHILAFESPPSFRTNFGLALEKVSAVRSKYSMNPTSVKSVGDRLEVLMCWLHSTILERALHYPIGFSKEYEFSESDLAAGWDAISSVIQRNDVNESDVLRITHLIIQCVYGSRVEHESDEEIVRALVESVINVDRVLAEPATGDTKMVMVVDADRPGKKEILAPTAPSKWEAFTKGLSSQSVGAWCYLPKNSSVVRETKDGADVLRKMLILCKQKFSSTGSRTPNSDTQPGHDSFSRFENLLQLGLSIPVMKEVVGSPDQELPLARFVLREKKWLYDATNGVRKDLIEMQEGGIARKEPAEIKVLRRELQGCTRNERMTVPSRWRIWSALYGERIALEEFFKRLSDSVQTLSDMTPDTKTLDMRAVVRPQALMTALQYEHSRRTGLSPHCLSCVVYGIEGFPTMAETENENRWILTGLRLDGARWNSDIEIFELDDNAGTGSIGGLVIGFTDGDSSNSENEKEIISVPLYARDRSKTPVWTMGLVVRTGQSVPKWRLNGVGVAIR